MTHGVRRLLTGELADEKPPPLGDLVNESVRQGLRMRRVRRLWTGAATAGVAGIAVGAMLIVGIPAVTSATGRTGVTSPQLGATGPSSSVSASPDPTTTTPPTSPPTATSTGRTTSPRSEPLVNATPEGLLELLTRLLPAGQTGGYAGDDDGYGLTKYVQVYLDRGRGYGMIRLSVYWNESALTLPCLTTLDFVCRDLPGGGRALIGEIPDNCIQRHVVEVRQPNGVVVSMSLASCLAWNGSTNPPSPIVLTPEEAIAIASDPRWGMRMPKELVDAGKRRFPSLPIFG